MLHKSRFLDQAEAARARLGPHGTRARAYGVHVLTASGVVFALLAILELFNTPPDPRWVFLWLGASLLVDSADGPLARLWDVADRAPRVGGRTIDDITDYLTFTFVPLLLIWRMGWVSEPATLWIALGMGASLFGFANADAKQAEEGFFYGFPSYWNVAALYAGYAATHLQGGPDAVAVGILLLAALTILPVRFLYPNQAPRPWRVPIIAGTALWGLWILALLPTYPSWPAWGGAWVLWISLVYPAFYLGLSAFLDVRARRQV